MIDNKILLGIANGLKIIVSVVLQFYNFYFLFWICDYITANELIKKLIYHNNDLHIFLIVINLQ